MPLPFMIWGLFFTLSFAVTSCFNDVHFRPETDQYPSTTPVKTKNVVVVIVDGLRFTEGWGDSTLQYIPLMSKTMAKQGVVNTRFYNNGDTYTSAGHTTITTGIYQTIDNSGNELPANPSIFQYWLKAWGQPQQKAWIIASKDKLAVLANTTHPAWNNQYIPSVNTGNEGNGIGSGYRHDSLTLITTLDILKNHHPQLVLINFREPDYSGHTGDWIAYTNAVKYTDKLVYHLWQFLEKDSFYSNTTTMFVTSDHGRHTNGIADGFASHGDGCEGCRHLGFFACGPDFKKGHVTNITRQQSDLTATIAHLMEVKMEKCDGRVMTELFLRTRD